MRLLPVTLLLLLPLGCRPTDLDTALIDTSNVTNDDADGDGVFSDEDCDDQNADVRPGADELCNGIDDDCDNQIDEDAVDTQTYYADTDGDGYGDTTSTAEGCEPPSGYVTNDEDCNDSSADFNPDAEEADCADPADYNCDGSVGYDDADGDGFAACEECDDASADTNPGATETPYDGTDNDCDPTTLDDDLDQDGVLGADDCDDTNPDVSPDADETPYDGIDNDCDETTLDDDLDGDGFIGAEDCDDTNADVNPNAVETPYDELDNDCNPATEDDDLDGDGYASDEDCDDSSAEINPGITETPYDGVDNDCDPSTLDDDLDKDGYAAAEDCDDTVGTVNPGAVEVPYDSLDNDCDPSTLDDDLDDDGYLGADDCDDTDPSVSPGASESVYDGVDNDCDPSTLDDDLDQDGFNNDADCDESDASINPGATETIYDGIDNDCDPGTLDDDLDQDGFNNDADCNESDSAINPGASETPYDGIDNDCDPSTLDDDLDQDGVLGDDDCDDTDSTINPSALEICDGVDRDCSGTPDDNEAIGTASSCAAESCTSLKDAGYGSGSHWVDVSDSPLEVWCDQTTEGGGWAILPPSKTGEWGDVNSKRTNKGQVMVYLRNSNGDREYTLTQQLAAYSQYDLDVSDLNATASRLTWIPRNVANVQGATQGFNSNGTDLTFTNCDANPNSYIELRRPGTTATSGDGYTFDDRWRDSAKKTSDAIPDDFFTWAELHQGGCGVLSRSPGWAADDGTLDVAFGVK